MAIFASIIALLLGVALIIKNTMVHASRSERMCREMVARLASSETKRIAIISAYIDADEERDNLRGQKLRAWDVPDGLGSDE